MNGDQFDRFVRDMLKEKNLPGLDDDPEIFDQIATDLKEKLLEQIDRAVIHAVPDDKVEGLNQLIDKSDVTDSAIHQYIVDSGVDTKEVAAKTMMHFRNLYIAGSGEREKV